MVQKKGPDKHDAAAAQPKKNPARSEKRLYSQQRHHQDGRGGGGGGGELKKMLKKSRSLKVLEESLASPLVQLGKPAAARKQRKKRPSPVRLPGTEPNYMKSTSSSNARKERAAHVSSYSPSPMAAANRGRIPKNTSKFAGHSKPSSRGASAPNPSKTLERKSSLRPGRSSMKKSLGIPLCPRINASRATCSSTMKETKFPTHLDLNQGGTETEGTSVLKVCPYTYCSLNGHRHPPLSPLKRFLSARRRLLKTQKSLKLRELPSFKKRGPAEDQVEIGTGQTELPKVASLVEDLGDDFFLEIYASMCPKQNPATVAGGNDDPDREAVDGMSAATDGEEGPRAQIEEHGEHPIDDSGSEVTSDDGNFDLGSDFSPSEMEVLVNFLEYVECDAAEDPPISTQDHADWCCDCCILAGSDEGLADGEGRVEPFSEAFDSDSGQGDSTSYIDFDEIDCSEFAGGESTDGVSLEVDVDGRNEAPLDVISDLPKGGGMEDSEEIVAEPAGEDHNSKSVEVESNGVFEQEDEVETAVDERGGAAAEKSMEVTGATLEDPIGDASSHGCSEVEVKGMLEPIGKASSHENDEEKERGMFEAEAAVEVCRETEGLMFVSITETNGDPFFGDGVDEEKRDAHGESAELCAASQSDPTVHAAEGATEEHDDGVETEMEQENTTAEETGDSLYNTFSDVNPHTAIDQEENEDRMEKDQDEASYREMETWESEKGEEDLQRFDETPVEGDDMFGASESGTASGAECPQDDEPIIGPVTSVVEEHTKGSNNRRARGAVTRRRANGEEEEELRPFNPRAPNFLSVEPDPEDEKVDLRHQLVDERKNAEEWMIDYALRRAVDKLAPGRKRKVELLVEAFETVTPVPPYGGSLGNSTVDFANARPMQACR